MIKTTPMIFNSEMVRALLAGNKTQTRRIIKQQPLNFEKFDTEKCITYKCPFGKLGSLIYVRETFGFNDPDYYNYETPMDVVYLAELNRPVTRMPEKWKPSIHMPRWASRLTLKINSVRVERIQDISEEDAKKEGISFLRNAPDYDETLTEKQLFECLWNSVYPESWNKNEWVWVIEFEVIHKNIDAVLAEMEQSA
jgi:hypothetical protein